MATPPRKLPSELAGGSTITRLIEDRAPREGRLPLGLGLHYTPYRPAPLFRPMFLWTAGSLVWPPAWN